MNEEMDRQTIINVVLRFRVCNYYECAKGHDKWFKLSSLLVTGSQSIDVEISLSAYIFCSICHSCDAEIVS